MPNVPEDNGSISGSVEDPVRLNFLAGSGNDYSGSRTIIPNPRQDLTFFHKILYTFCEFFVETNKQCPWSVNISYRSESYLAIFVTLEKIFVKFWLFSLQYHYFTFFSDIVSDKQCSGSMTFWCGSGSADPCLWLLNLDPAIFVIYLQDDNKYIYIIWKSPKEVTKQ